MLHVVLYQPEIPGNTGNVIRLCANTGARLHLIRPLGFELEDSKLKRAGLDYHEWASLQVYDRLSDCLQALAPGRVYACTTKGSQPHHLINYQDGDVFLFGPETRGLPPEVLEQFSADHRVRLPMLPHSRSLNLANAVSVMIYEGWRQLGFPGGV